MRFFLLVLLFVLASLAFAQDECFDLCSSCMNNDKQDVCAKVESLCNCSKILESLKQELLTNSSSSADTVQVDQAVPDTNTQQTDSLAKADSSIHNDSAITVVTTQDTQVVEKRQAPSLGEQNINVTISVVTEKEKAEEKKDRIFYFFQLFLRVCRMFLTCVFHPVPKEAPDICHSPPLPPRIMSVHFHGGSGREHICCLLSEAL